MRNKINYSTNYPIAFYVGILIVAAIFINTLLRIQFPDSLLYPSIVFILWFATISRYSCKVTLYNDKLVVKYLLFWHKDIEINLSELKVHKVRTSYWSFNFDYDTNSFRGYIFYDQVTLTNKKNEKQIIRINTRIGKFGKLIDKLNEALK